MVQTLFNVSTANQLSQAIAQIDRAASQIPNTAFTINVLSGAMLAETSDVSAINLSNQSDTLTINGNGAVLDGGGAHRGLFVYSGTVAINDLTIQNAVASGGQGGNGGGGGGAGLGGGLFVANDYANAAPGTVTLTNVSFENCGAQGGAGGSANYGGGGGGGLGGAGGPSSGGSNGQGGGGGGISGSGSQGDSPQGGAQGIVVGAASGGSSGARNGQILLGGASGGGGGGGGGIGGGVGGAGGGIGGGGASATQGLGGNGGFGGGGGGFGYVLYQFGPGGNGGFGGGGGSGYVGRDGPPNYGGNGGFGGGGGGGGFVGEGGFGAHAGYGMAGGGGLGAGGDIFVMAGGHLTIAGTSSIGAGSVQAGPGSYDQGSDYEVLQGEAYGNGLFIEGGGSVALGWNLAAGTVLDVAGTVADMTGSHDPSGQTGNGQLVIGGTSTGGGVNQGTVRLDAQNTYTGGTQFNSGTLEIAAGASAGSGTINFGNSESTTLKLDGTVHDGAVFANTLALNENSTLDVCGLAYEADAMALPTFSGLLNVTSDGVTESFTLANVNPYGIFWTTSDGSGGTLVHYSGDTFPFAFADVAESPSAAQAAPADAPSTGQGSGHPHVVVLHGTVANAATMTNIEIYANGKDRGAAAIDATTDTWSFTLHYGAGRHRNRDLTAVATDENGATQSVKAAYELVTGVTEQPFTSVENYVDPTTRALRGQTFLNADGSVYEKDAMTTEADGSTRVTTYGGTAFSGTPDYAVVDRYDASGTLTEEDQHNQDGTHLITGKVAGQTLSAIANDTITATGGGNTFVFAPAFGQDTVTNFITGGSDHDTLSLAQSDFATVADVLRHTHNTAAGAVIADPFSGDTITLTGLTEAQLKAHPAHITLR